MINWKYFTVGHATHLLYNPLNPTKLDEVIELAALPQGACECIRKTFREIGDDGIDVSHPPAPSVCG